VLERGLWVAAATKSYCAWPCRPVREHIARGWRMATLVVERLWASTLGESDDGDRVLNDYSRCDVALTGINYPKRSPSSNCLTGAYGC
jgi:hypothetical protein